MELEWPLPECSIDLRDAFFGEVNEAAMSDSRVVVVTDDQAAWKLEWLRQNRPRQYINIGVAEQNLIGVSAGLALSGKRPVAFGIANFMTARCLEQIRNELCAMELPVTLVVLGAGFSYSHDGPTHHAVQDVAIMRALPGMVVLNPADAASTADAARFAHGYGMGPVYVRLERGTPGRLYPEDHDFAPGFQVFGQAGDALLVATGNMVHRALEAAWLLIEQGIRVSVMDMYRLKPVQAPFLAHALARYDVVVSLEEHTLNGGLGSIVSEIITDYGLKSALLRIGLPNRFDFIYGTREALQDMAGLGADQIASQVKLLLGGRQRGRSTRKG
ncbi:MAG: transketolase C-terminal domain-containing protein [Dehalococcoidia bacterium]|nr:transketolase C-terminal domain-containing protein [Dehalococcoidia bacterium]